MTIEQALRAATLRLNLKSECPHLEAGLILAYLLKKEKWYLTAHNNEIINEETEKLFFKLIEKRLSGLPLQYITGMQEFMSLEFSVNENVLIPRPETELLVEEVINYSKKLGQDKVVRIVDMCTGSGCIAISLSKFIPNSEVLGLDISTEALQVAKLNAYNLKVTNVNFIESDMFENITNRKFDIVVSNPPYIAKKVIESLQEEVSKYEPNLALDGGEDGLDFYREIIERAYLYIEKGGILALEIGYDQGEALRKLIEENNNYQDFKIVKDLNGLDRVVIANKL